MSGGILVPVHTKCSLRSLCQTASPLRPGLLDSTCQVLPGRGPSCSSLRFHFSVAETATSLEIYSRPSGWIGRRALALSSCSSGTASASAGTTEPSRAPHLSYPLFPARHDPETSSASTPHTAREQGHTCAVTMGAEHSRFLKGHTMSLLRLHRRNLSSTLSGLRHIYKIVVLPEVLLNAKLWVTLLFVR